MTDVVNDFKEVIYPIVSAAASTYHDFNPNPSDTTYILMSAQTATADHYKNAYNQIVTLDLQVVERDLSTASFDGVDAICGTILGLMAPYFQSGVDSANIQYNDLKLQSDFRLPTFTDASGNTTRRVLRFQAIARHKV